MSDMDKDELLEKIDEWLTYDGWDKDEYVFLAQLKQIAEQHFGKPKVTRGWVEKWARDLSVYPTYDKRSVRLLKSMLSELGVEVEDGN